MEKLYWFDINRRVYNRDANGNAFGGPIYREHFREINIKPNDDWQRIDRKRQYVRGKEKYRTYTETEMQDAVYIHDNANKIAERVRQCKDADLLRKIAELLPAE